MERDQPTGAATMEPIAAMPAAVTTSAFSANLFDSGNLARCAEALERIADVLTFLITQPADVPTCPHPDAEREVAPGSTMDHLAYRCQACGGPCPEPGV